MKGHPESHLDPTYDRIEARVAAQTGVPQSLIAGIRTRGERSDASAVSSAGARTVYQFTPSTRRLVMNKYGVDPWASAENAAQSAALLLKEGMDRNNGDQRAAVREYVGGLDPRNWKATTRGYVARVMGGSGTDTLQGGAEGRVLVNLHPEPSASLRASSSRKAATIPPSLVARFNDPTSDFTAEARRAMLADVKAGRAVLPDGLSLDAKVVAKPAHPAVIIPQRVIRAYNDRAGMNDGERTNLENDIANGYVALPPGAKLVRPPPRTAGESFGMGVRGVGTSLGGALDLAANPLIATYNAQGEAVDAMGRAMGFKGQSGVSVPYNPGRNLANSTADALGLAKPETNPELLANAAIEGATGGLLGVGAGAAMAGAPGMAGTVGRALAASPIVDTVSGATAGASSEAVRQNGGGPLAQMTVGLLAGGGTAVAGSGVARVASRFGRPVARIVETVPERAAFHADGTPTAEGRFHAAEAGASTDDLRAAYAHANENPAPARAAQGDPVEPVRPVDATGAPNPSARPQEPPSGATAGAAESVDTVPQDTSPTATARLSEAQSEGVPLTRGQALQDPAIQKSEQTMLGTHDAEAVAFRERQQAAIKAATDRFEAAIGQPDATTMERGAEVKGAMRKLRDQGQAGVRALYQRGAELAAKLGDNSKALLDLDHTDILAKLRELWTSKSVAPQDRDALRQIAAQYGLIGKNPRGAEGIWKVDITDETGKVIRTEELPHPPERLNVVNAEEMHKAVSDLYDPTGARSNAHQAVKKLIDEATINAVERAASADLGTSARPVADSFKAGRKAHRVQMQTFKAGDVVQNLIAWKKGHPGTEAVDPEAVFRHIFAGGPEGTSALKRVKAVLLNKPTPASRNAWKAIKAQGVGQIFKDAISPTGEVSGLRMATAIRKFGPEKLKVLLDTDEFNQLMKLQRIIKHATVPLPNTTNPSGSGYRVIEFLSKVGKNIGGVGRAVPVVGPAIDVVAGLVKQGREVAQAERTLAGITDFGPGAAEAADAAASNAAKPKTPEQTAAALREFIDAISSPSLLGAAMGTAVQDKEAQP